MHFTCPHCHTPFPAAADPQARYRECAACGKATLLSPPTNGRQVVKWIMLVLTVLWVGYTMFVGLMALGAPGKNLEERYAILIILAMGTCMTFGMYVVSMGMLGFIYFQVDKPKDRKTGP